MADARIKIPAELFAVAESSHFEGELDWPTLSAGLDELAFNGPLTWEVEVMNTDGALLVEGNVHADARTTCARCLGDVDLELDGTIEGWFLLSEEDAGPEDVGDDELEILPDDHIIDLAPLISAALIMEVPNPPLCSPDCAGLCPTCGADLNDGPCECVAVANEVATMNPDNPFSILANFDFGE